MNKHNREIKMHGKRIWRFNGKTKIYKIYIKSDLLRKKKKEKNSGINLFSTTLFFKPRN